MNQRRNTIVHYLSVAILSLSVAGVTACGQAGDSGPVPESATASAGQSANGPNGGSDGSCQTIQGTVNIESQADLAQFADLDCFTVERHLFVQDTTDITDLSALSGLRSTGGYIGIADNTALVDASLPNLEETGEGLVLEGNPALETIEFASLRHVSGYLHVFNNQSLQSASFPWLLGVGDDLIFAGNDALTNLDLSRLTCVMGTFIFEHSDALECLCLPNLVIVNGDFKVHFNGALKSLSAPVLTTVWGEVVIERNPQLAHLDLSCLEQVIGDFTVLHNFALAQCTVDELVADIDTIGGDVVTGDNAEECPEEPVTAEDVGCAECVTNICVPGEQPPPPPPPVDAGPDAGPDAGMDAGQPDVGQPTDVGGIDVSQPDVGQPDVGQPDVGQPDVGQPDVGQPDVGQPDVGQPDVGQPDVGQPDVGQPDVGEDAGEEPITGRMTGGGRIGAGLDRVTHGFQLHCDLQGPSDNLQINWGRGNSFHLEELLSVTCSDAPSIEEGQPPAGFDTMTGMARGRYNGESGATVEYTFTDAGEPGRDDFMSVIIRDSSGEVVLEASGTLRGGNHQAHRDNQ